jgi:hypothetical protein
VFVEKLIEPCLPFSSFSRVTILDMAELHPKAKSLVPVVRQVISLYNQMVSFYKKFDDGNIEVADDCTFTAQNGYVLFTSVYNCIPFFLVKLTPVRFDLHSVVCSGGLTDFSTNPGTRQLLQMSREMEEVFVTYDAWGNPISPQHRFLTSDCQLTFAKPDCIGICTGCPPGAAKTKCSARKLACKASSLQGLSLPFLKDPIKVIGLFSGKDIE